MRLDPETFLPCEHCGRQTAHRRQGISAARILRAALLGLILPGVLVSACAVINAASAPTVNTFGEIIAPSPKPLDIPFVLEFSCAIIVVWFFCWLIESWATSRRGRLYCMQCGTPRPTDAPSQPTYPVRANEMTPS